MGAGNRAFMDTQKQGSDIKAILAAFDAMDDDVIPGILGRIGALEMQGADHASRIGTAETQIADHETRIATLEGA